MVESPENMRTGAQILVKKWPRLGVVGGWHRPEYPEVASQRVEKDVRICRSIFGDEKFSR